MVFSRTTRSSEQRPTQSIGSLLQPTISAAIEQRGLLVEDDLPIGRRRQPTIDEPLDIVDAEAVEPGHQVDVLIEPGERTSLADLLVAQKVRVRCRAQHWRGPADESPVKKGELGINARDRSIAPSRARDPQRDPLRQHDVEDLVLKRFSGQPRADGQVDRPVVIGTPNGLRGSRLEPEHPIRRQGPAAGVVLADLHRRGTVLVDDEKNVVGPLGGG